MRFSVPLVTAVVILGQPASADQEFQSIVKPMIRKYCIDCHSGDDANGEIDFDEISTDADIELQFDVLESAVEHLKAQTMPPADEPQPTTGERGKVLKWYETYLQNIRVRPANFKPRKLSVIEYRNTLESLLGFKLKVAVIEAEQTLAERSLVIKLLPTDPPGKSGFTNDTHENPLSMVAWDQYSYLVDTGLSQLFSSDRKSERDKLIGGNSTGPLTGSQARRLLQNFVIKAWRRPVADREMANILNRVADLEGRALIDAVQFEMKAALMSPRFLYRGLLATGIAGQQQVDSHELAERLSYFLWADMPDNHLMSLAANDTLGDPDVLRAEIDRMLASPGARSLADVFATQWLTLNEIEQVSDNPPLMLALKSQAVDFMNYLFTQDRPLLELIDSDATFINPHTARMYGRDARQMTKYVRQRGIEIEAVPNQQVQLKETRERGGLLTMPGILAMNRGPILRGTWILERILGEDLPDPPPDVGQVAPNRPDEQLSFRQRFEQHRSNASCAACHDKIDPLGFALQEFDNSGKFVHHANYRPPKKRKRDRKKQDITPGQRADTSGKLPSGESFSGIDELKDILKGSQKQAVIRNIVERTMSYALCRKLMIYDRPVVDSITKHMIETNGTWRNLFHAVANSVPFREAVFAGSATSASAELKKQQ